MFKNFQVDVRLSYVTTSQTKKATVIRKSTIARFPLFVYKVLSNVTLLHCIRMPIVQVLLGLTERSSSRRLPKTSFQLERDKICQKINNHWFLSGVGGIFVQTQIEIFFIILAERGRTLPTAP